VKREADFEYHNSSDEDEERTQPPPTPPPRAYGAGDSSVHYVTPDVKGMSDKGKRRRVIIAEEDYYY